MFYVPLWLDIIERPNWKILDLEPEVFRFWCLCLLAAQKFDYVDGFLPDDRTLSAWIQMNRDMTVTLRDKAVTRHVLDLTEDGRYKIHAWEEWRDVKDQGATKRKRDQRARDKAKDVSQKGVKNSDEGNVTGESRNGHASSHGLVTGLSQDVTPKLLTLNYKFNTPEGECDVVSEKDEKEEDSELHRIAILASELSGSLSWMQWVSQQAKLGHPTHAIETALNTCVDTGKWSHQYASGILRRLCKEGYPRNEQAKKLPLGKCRTKPEQEYKRAPADDSWKGPGEQRKLS